MAPCKIIDEDTLKKEIKAVIKGADLSQLTSRLVRTELEQKFGFNLKHQKDQIDKIVMAEIDDQGLSHSEDELSDQEPTISKKKKRAADSDAEDNDDDYAPAGKNKKIKGKRRSKGSEDDVSDEEWGKRKKAQQAKKPAAAAAATGGGGGRGKQSAFTRAFKLSPELADVVGSDVMPRHEVVKRLWAVIKERELQDPKNKQFAICDDQLMKVFGVKRFRTFGMMKHLKDHFLEAA